MPEKTQLFITDPCHERWGDMQPNADGRFCGSCRKTVVDFTMMSDQEVLSWLSGAGKSVCGRFMEDQLNRDLVPARLPKRNRWTVWWQLLLAGVLMSSEVSAQERTIRIVDTVTGQPVPWAYVSVDKLNFVADSAGFLSIARERILQSHELTISSVGYEKKKLPMDKSTLNGGVQTVALVRAGTLGLVTVVSYGAIKCRWSDTIYVRTYTWKDTLVSLGICKKPISVYPNPVARGASVTLSVQTGKRGTYMAQLFSSAGTLVESMRIEGVDGPRTELMSIPGTAAAGLYFLRLQHEQTGKVYTQKVEVL